VSTSSLSDRTFGEHLLGFGGCASRLRFADRDEAQAAAGWDVLGQYAGGELVKGQQLARRFLRQSAASSSGSLTAVLSAFAV
jgi:hypothetical protein